MSKLSRAKARRRLLLVAIIFAAPLVGAYALYFSGWRPHAVHPHGDLITPAHPVADVVLSSLDGAPMRFSSLRPQWLLVYFGSGDCSAACELAIYTMRQVIVAQGRESHRLRSVLVISDPRAKSWVAARATEYPNMATLVSPPERVAELAREFKEPAGNLGSDPERIYVVDPLGNVMMSYSLRADPAGIRKDLARLLRVSQIG